MEKKGQSDANLNSAQDTRYKPIEDYGIIGDLHTIALISREGSIDWCCFPHFDSSSVFARLLDYDKGGFFQISANGNVVNKQMYMPETAILVTRFLSYESVAEIIDFMPSRRDVIEKNHVHQIIRIVRAVRGNMSFSMKCFPAFDYARENHRSEVKENSIIFSTSTEKLQLMHTIPVKKQGQKKKGVTAEFSIKQGEEEVFILKRYNSPKHGEHVPSKSQLKKYAWSHFNQTSSFWTSWIEGCSYKGRWREMIQRSAITLKLLTFAPTGAIVAAPTTSLPEQIGGVRNWDYRFTWVRDAAFTVYALMRIGLTRETEHFMQWINARSQEEGEDGSLQIMYGLHGEHDLREVELKHFEGYRGSRPVRIGNAAHNQLQLDIYGELLDSIYLANKYSKPIPYDVWRHVERLLNYVCNNWQRKDHGIWEIRGGEHHFVYSKLMCWVALDRGLRLASKRGFPAERQKWLQIRDTIYKQIMEKGWHKKRKAFVQHYETDALDASNLMMPLTLFISPTDPRMTGTLDETLKHLVSDSLVNRYQIGHGASDGLVGCEGTFSICTFWLVEALTRAGRLNQARWIFEKMLSYSNHVGLYSEQIGLSGEALGNTPQAFTHLGLISAAFNLNRALGD